VPVAVLGLRELQAAFAKTEKTTRLGVRAVLRETAEPVRADAEALAGARITRIGPKWPKMRTGVTRNLIYVVPRQKGTHGRGRGSEARRRADAKFAAMVWDRAMEPALNMHSPEIERSVEQALDKICDQFNYGGPL
jgi:hypothetical protein